MTNDHSIVTTDNHLAPSAAMARRDARNVSIEPVTVDIIQDEKPIGLIAIGIIALILTGFGAWTVSIVRPSIPGPIIEQSTYRVTDPNSL